MDAHQRAGKGKCYTYQEEKSQYGDKISEPSSTHVNAIFTGNQFRQSRPCAPLMMPLHYASGRLKVLEHEIKALLEEQPKKEE